MDSKKKARCPPSRYCTLCLDVTTRTSIPASSIKRSSRSASKGMGRATCLTTSSMSEAPRGPTAAACAAIAPGALGRCGSYTRAARSGHAFASRQMRRAGARDCRTWAYPSASSVPIARIEAVEHTKVSRPISGAATAVVLAVLHHGLLANVGRDLDQLAAGRFHAQLDFSGLQQMLHQDESLARGLAHREHTVVVHDHGAIVAEVGDDSLSLVEVLGNPLVGMIAERAEETHRFLRDHPQAALESCNRHSRPSMHVHRAVHVRSPPQDGAVQRKAWTVDAGALVQVLVHINLDEIRGGDLRPQ